MAIHRPHRLKPGPGGGIGRLGAVLRLHTAWCQQLHTPVPQCSCPCCVLFCVYVGFFVSTFLTTICCIYIYHIYIYILYIVSALCFVSVFYVNILYIVYTQYIIYRYFDTISCVYIVIFMSTPTIYCIGSILYSIYYIYYILYYTIYCIVSAILYLYILYIVCILYIVYLYMYCTIYCIYSRFLVLSYKFRFERREIGVDRGFSCSQCMYGWSVWPVSPTICVHLCRIAVLGAVCLLHTHTIDLYLHTNYYILYYIIYYY